MLANSLSCAIDIVFIFFCCIVTIQTLAKLKPKGIKVLGTMAMVRNSVGAGKMYKTIWASRGVGNRSSIIIHTNCSS